MAKPIDPTPEEIAERSREVRAGWTAKVRHDRQVVKPVRWTPDLCDVEHAEAQSGDLSEGYET